MKKKKIRKQLKRVAKRAIRSPDSLTAIAGLLSASAIFSAKAAVCVGYIDRATCSDSCRAICAACPDVGETYCDDGSCTCPSTS